MKNYYLILALAFLLVLPMVMSVNYYDQGSEIVLTEVCRNNGTYCTSAANCNITVFYPDSTIFVEEAVMDYNESYFNYTISGALSGTRGTYTRDTTCCDGGLCASATDTFVIGAETTTSDSLLYTVLLVIMCALFGLFLWGSFAIPGGNLIYGDGTLASINNLKYAKLACILFSYLSLMFIMYISRGISTNLLHFDIASGIFTFISGTMLALLGPILVVFIIFGVISFLTDKRLMKLVKRGFSVKI